MTGPESEPKRENEKEPPYVRAARYPTEQTAGRAYFQAQNAIFAVECDLSAYRIQMPRGVWHVAVVGIQPLEKLDQKITAILSTGETVTLPPEAAGQLLERKAQAKRIGPWVEGHYRPGRPL